MKQTGRTSFYTEIARNKRNSYFLMTGIFFALLILVYVISLALDPSLTFIILIAGTIISILYIWIGYTQSDKIALASVNATKADKDRYKQYHDSVESIAIASGMPKPDLYVMQDSHINAFATGKDPEHGVMCFTTGALEKLNKQELEGVIAHEMAHIANYDIRFMTVAAVLIGLISIISHIFLRSLWFGGGNNRGNDRSQAIFLIIAIVLAILTPILVSLVQLAISRKREYAADSTAVKFTRSPTGLIGALKKIKHDHEPARTKVPSAMAPLFIRKPSKAKEWFSTHPPLEKRIALLERM